MEVWYQRGECQIPKGALYAACHQLSHLLKGFLAAGAAEPTVVLGTGLVYLPYLIFMCSPSGGPSGRGVQVHCRRRESQSGVDQENGMSFPGNIVPFQGPVYGWRRPDRGVFPRAGRAEDRCSFPAGLPREHPKACFRRWVPLASEERT